MATNGFYLAIRGFQKNRGLFLAFSGLLLLISESGLVAYGRFIRESWMRTLFEDSGAVVQLPELPIGVKSSTFASTTWALLFGLITGTFAFGVSFLTIFQHLVHYNSPKLQKFIVRILMVVPIYSVLSLLCLLAPPLFLYFEVFRDIWEAAVIYFFMQLILVYCGGESSCAYMIQQNPGTIRHAFPMSLCWRKEIPCDPSFVKSSKRATLQFVIVKPLMGVISIVVFACGSYYSIWWRSVEGIVYNTSYSIALYALVLFYVATRQHPGLKGSNPVRKFLAVKLIVFATFWQSFFLQFVPGLSDHELRAWVNFILLLEMPFFSVLQAWAFPIGEFSHLHTATNSRVSSMSIGHEEKELESAPTEGSWDACSSVGRPGDDIKLATEPQHVLQTPSQAAVTPTFFDLEEVADSSHSHSNSRNLPENSESFVMQAAAGLGSSIAKVPKKLIPKRLKTQLASVADPDQRRKALDNVMEAVNMNDVVSDAYYNFNSKYQEHAMMENDDENTVIEEEVDESPRIVSAMNGVGFDPQLDTDFSTGPEGSDVESRSSATAGSASKSKKPHLYFYTHLPGFTDHPTQSSGKEPNQESDWSFRQRRHSETRMSRRNTPCGKDDEEDTRASMYTGTCKRISTPRSVSSDDVSMKTSTPATAVPQDYWAEGEFGWEHRPGPRPLPPPTQLHSRSRNNIPSPPTSRKRATAPPPPSDGGPTRGRVPTRSQESSIAKSGANRLRRVIGRPSQKKPTQFMSIGGHDDYDSDNSGGAVEVSGDESVNATEQFTWQKAPDRSPIQPTASLSPIGHV